jgi:hypothetical protein
MLASCIKQKVDQAADDRRKAQRLRHESNAAKRRFVAGAQGHYPPYADAVPWNQFSIHWNGVCWHLSCEPNVLLRLGLSPCVGRRRETDSVGHEARGPRPTRLPQDPAAHRQGEHRLTPVSPPLACFVLHSPSEEPTDVTAGNAAALHFGELRRGTISSLHPLFRFIAIIHVM